MIDFLCRMSYNYKHQQEVDKANPQLSMRAQTREKKDVQDLNSRSFSNLELSSLLKLIKGGGHNPTYDLKYNNYLFKNQGE